MNSHYICTPEQEEVILKIVREKPSIHLKELTRLVFSNDKLDGRSIYGRAIRQVLKKHQIRVKNLTTYESIAPVLNKEQEQFILSKMKEVPFIVIARDLFQKRNISALDGESIAVKNFIKSRGNEPISLKAHRRQERKKVYESLHVRNLLGANKRRFLLSDSKPELEDSEESLAFALYWRNIQKGAFDRYIEFLISKDDGWKIYKEQQRLCSMTGLPLVFTKPECSASLDRIDSNLPYRKDNVQWVHKTINRMKYSLNQNEFVVFCRLVAKKHP